MFIIGVACCVYAAFASFQLARHQSSLEIKDSATSRVINPFIVNDVGADLFADEQINTLVMQAREQLKFMPFAAERRKAAKVVLSDLQQKINLNPFSYKLWSELVALQADAGKQAPERLWSLKVASQLGGWYFPYRLETTSICLESTESLLKQNPLLCRQLLQRLPYPDLAQNARAMGFTEEAFKARLARLERDYIIMETQSDR